MFLSNNKKRIERKEWKWNCTRCLLHFEKKNNEFEKLQMASMNLFQFEWNMYKEYLVMLRSEK